MSARKIANPDLVQSSFTVQAHTTRLDLPANAVRIRKNGIEFRSAGSIPVWTEMTVSMLTPANSRRVNFSGVVVACNGNRHAGFMVSLLFTNVSKAAQARLNSMAVAP
jgi:hypothetical protein